MSVLRKPEAEQRLSDAEMRRLLGNVVGSSPETAPRRARRPLYVAGLAGTALVAGAAWWSFGSGNGNAQASAEPKARPAAAARPSAPGSVLDASGYVVAARSATVSSETTGRLAAVYVTEGMRVSKGQLLARLDTRDLDQQVALAEAQLAATQRSRAQQGVELDAALDRYGRLARLHDQRFTTETDFKAAEFNVARGRAALSSSDGEIAIARRRVQMQRQFRSNTSIVAPFDGLVTETAAQVGEIVSPISAGGGFTRTGICTLVDVASIQVRVQVNEKYIGRIRTGQRVDIVPRAYPDLRLAGQVTTIMPAASRQTGAVEVIVAFVTRDERVLPNMSVDVSFRAAPEGKIG
jgi:RND family efflux transporter MFP subunit